MALFGEKYGDVVRVVQVGDGSWSRELCGGTHVRSTAEIGVFKLVGESSSAANVRRIEALTGPEAVALLRRHDALLRDAATALRRSPSDVPSAVADLQEKAKKARSAPSSPAVDPAALLQSAAPVGDAHVLLAVVEGASDAKVLAALMDRVKSKVDVVVLGSGAEGRAHLVAAVDPDFVARGVKAGDIVRTAAKVVGGGGGGRDTMAQAGGRDASKLPEALDAAREAIAAALAAS
jgi:alanyl-tRNA synthetase